MDGFFFFFGRLRVTCVIFLLIGLPDSDIELQDCKIIGHLT